MAKNPVKSVNLLPEFLRTDKNSKFLSSTLDQLINPSELERLDGFVGSKITPTFSNNRDVYIKESSKLRRDYQLEPALVVKNEFTEVKQVKAIDDLANEINAEGGIVNNFDSLFSGQIYSFNPQIDFDKFVNFQKYYWLSTGPQSVEIFGKQLSSTSTYTVVDNEIKTAWIFSPDGLTEDPTIVLYKGNTYNFQINSQFKFYIKTSPSVGLDDIYNLGVTNNGSNIGVVTINVTENTPGVLYYTNDKEGYVGGKIVIKQTTEDSFIDVEKEILGKENYTSQSGLTLSNGMKIKFGGEVFPTEYSQKEFFVEGVGRSIKLIDYTLLTGSENLSAQYDDDFDVANFDEYPFDNFQQIPVDPEYITINRASKDLNPWSRYNRWVHEDVIKTSAEYNNIIPIFPIDKRAKRPIIEFAADLQLYNFGTIGIENIDLIDNVTLDAFSTVEGSAGYYVDGVLLQQGHRIVFNADTDDLVRGRIYKVNYNFINNQPKLELIKTDDHIPDVKSSLSTRLGVSYSGKSWWFNGDVWVIAQQHDKLNQPPLFEAYNESGISYSDPSLNTNFAGTKIFGYEVGTGTNDNVLGFPLVYQNLNNVSSYKFKNYFGTDIVTIFQNNQATSFNLSNSFLKINNSPTEQFVNTWSAAKDYRIPILQLVSVEQDTTVVEITALDNIDTVQFELEVFKNNIKLPSQAYFLTKYPNKCFVNFEQILPANTNILFKIYSLEVVNQNGQYETPISLTNNPLNQILDSMTLTELSDHFKTMTERSDNFIGSVFGNNNSRDIKQLADNGTRLISNHTPISFSHFFIGIKEHDVVKALQLSSEQYNSFKSALFRKISQMGNINDPISALDIALTDLNADKDLNSAWYNSIMMPYGNDKTTRSWIITDLRNTIYPLISDYDPHSLQVRSVLVYLNNQQLILGKDYNFIVDDASIELLLDFNIGDTLRVEDYFSAKGCYVPSTPTHLGLYPKFEPKIYIDDSYTTPIKVIQGHDGSITKAFNDFRDEIILEYEKRIFNNIKINYNREIFDINSILPGAFRNTAFKNDKINQILYNDFLKWINANNVEYISNTSFDLENPFTWNYYEGYNADLKVSLLGHWRNVFKYLYDTDRPNTHPWEMLGFSVQPDWWEDTYGPSPCTSGNNLLWQDLELGIIRSSNTYEINSKYSRPGLSKIIPVDQFGNLIDPNIIVTNLTNLNIRKNWEFGEQGPAETSWRRSSYYPFAVQRLLALINPSRYCSLLYDPSRITKNISGQYVYNNKGFLNLKNLEINGDNETLTSGFSVYIADIGSQRNSLYIEQLKSDLRYLDFNLFHKVGGFVSKDKLQIVIDSIDPLSPSSGALLPPENYQLILNTGNTVRKVGISGIIIQKSNGKFVVKGYDRYKPYFTIFQPRRISTTPAITVGGISEPFVRWQASEDGGNSNLSAEDTTSANSVIAGNFYRQGQVVFYNEKYYRTKISHRAGVSFNLNNFQLLPNLPTQGGAVVQIARSFDQTPSIINYGTEYDNIQKVYDLIIGYGKWLVSQGFMFDEYNTELNELLDWNLSAKEFLFWTTQNWAENSIITLSPFANSIKFTSENSVVDNLFDSFYEYSVFKADGLPFPQKGLNIKRDDRICTISTIGTNEGIYFAELNLVQKEHAMIFDNKSIFSDIIYDMRTGYRQRRMKLVGFRTKNWNGDYISPGFVYDQAQIQDWNKFVTYIYGDVVRYNGKYYSAKQNITGSTSFDYNSWILLNEKPVQDLIPNFEYKINQFEDFYSLDIDNFDTTQQQLAQNLIGYTPRVYLYNIFTNPISQYKFYQGFIKEKGTRNALNKMSKASIFNLQGDTDYTEEWALRLGHFGGYTSFEELEINLQEGTFIENPQVVNFIETRPINANDLIFYSTVSNILLKPVDYQFEKTFVTTSTNNFIFPNAGYVHFEDITATAYNETSLLDIANNQEILQGQIFWLGFTQQGSWDVLRYTLLESRVTGVYVNSPGVEITFVTDFYHNLSVGDIVSIVKFNNQVNGVYKVKSVGTLNQFTVNSQLTTIVNEELLSPGLLFQFKSVRSKDFDNLPADKDMLKFDYMTKFWVDNQNNDGFYNWKIFRKIDNFTEKNFTSNFSIQNENFGKSVKTKGDNIVIVGSPGFNNNIDKGRTYVYVKLQDRTSGVFSFAFNDDNNYYHASGQETEFGSAIDYSKQILPGTNYGLFYAGAPKISNVKTTGTILRISTFNSSIEASTYSGAVKVISFNPVTLNQNTEIVIVSPVNQSYQNFGASLNFNDVRNLLMIGAPGQGLTTGSVYLYQNFIPQVSTSIVTTSTSGTNKLFVLSTASIKLGQSILIPSYKNDITNAYTVENIVDNGNEQYIEINQNLDVTVNANSKVKFYNTSNIVTTFGVNTSSNGIITTFIGTITGSTSSIINEFGYAIAASEDGKFTAISAPGVDTVETFINIDSNTVIRQVHTSTIGNGRFGESIALSQDGKYLFIGAPDIKNADDSFGKVAVYIRAGNTFSYHSSIVNPVSKAGLKFGQDIIINNTTDTLVISAIGLNKSIPVQFDNDTTQFDNSSTNFYDQIDNFGTIYIYNKIDSANRFVLADEILPDTIAGAAGTNFGYSLAIDNQSIFIGAPCLNSVTTSSVYQYDKINKSKLSLEEYKTNEPVVDIDTIQKVKLIDTFSESVVDYLDVIDPIKGKIAGIAEQELRYKSAYDPAIYSLGTAGVVVDADTSWLDAHVGELWWDLSTVKYVWYEQGDLLYRKNNWGTIFPGATIDVYEWVQTSLLPSEWSTIADTSEGLTQGISGQPKYIDNSNISVKQIYNSVSNSFSNVYYYWVKNKVTVPNSQNRRISAYQIANIIADPTGYGLKTIAIIKNDALSLSNVGTTLIDNRINLNIAQDTIKNNIPKHTEWTLIEEGSANSSIPTLYEKKLFDSLLGKDSLGNPVPDPNLSEREKYGISIRPRQTMFKNRKEALRSLIEFTNDVLSKNIITGDYSFINLNAQEDPPEEYLGQYDQIVEDNEALNIIDTRFFEQAELTCTVENGKLRSVSIVNPGFGYKIAPNVVIENIGVDAQIETQLDNFGRVISATILSSGSGYNTVPLLLVRPYSIIVLADSLYNNKWTKFEWNKLNNQWERKRTQKYNTKLYWNYIDWKSETYNEFIDYTYTIEQVYQLDTLEDIIPGQYVKIKNVGDGRYIVVEKSQLGEEGTFGKGYNLVYSQRGTLEISDDIWNTAESNLGFDQNNTFDQTLFDQAPDLELNFILTALKEDIFINELKVNWNLFFFKAVKYALTEQKLLDWAFKTSFINVINFAGELDQRPVYKIRSSENYEQYLKEIKPYHSQIRTFTANHQITEPSNSYFTDFDLPSYYNKNIDKFQTIELGNELLNETPYKDWGDNHTYKVGKILIGDGGSGYLFAPQVVIETVPGDAGSGATARAYLTSGKVSSIEILNPGSNYKQTPKVTLIGGGDANLNPAVAYAQLTNEKVRVNSVTVKFDRTSSIPLLSDNEAIDTFICNGSTNEYTLTWLAKNDKTTMSVTLNGELVLNSNYKINQYNKKYNGYNKQFTKLVFVNNIPVNGEVLEVKYQKNILLYNAVDRIKNYYQPQSGMPGNELSQLMEGIKFPGSNIEGLPFNYSAKWDSPFSNYGVDSYADDVAYYKTVSVTANAPQGTDTFFVSTTTGIVKGQLVNVLPASKALSTSSIFYQQRINDKFEVRIIDITSSTRRIKFNSTISVALNAVSKQIYINNALSTVTSTATVELWSYDSNSYLLDSIIEGGGWNTSTGMLTGALGINPEDIIVSGEEFNSQDTNYGPEELVPGHINESFGLNVYTRLYEGAPKVFNYILDISENTVTSFVSKVLPANIANVFVTHKDKNFAYTTNTNLVFTSATNNLYFTIDWSNKTFYIAPQNARGKLGITILGIGGGENQAITGVLDNDIKTVYDGKEARLVSYSNSTTVKRAYVTVNGVTIPKLETINTTTTGYILGVNEVDPNRAGVHVINLSTATTQTVQAYFFGTIEKYYNESYQQVFSITTATTTLTIDNVPGNIQPDAIHAIVELDSGNGFIRLQPPFVSYYKITDITVLTYKVDKNIERGPNTLLSSDIRVYVNGSELVYIKDWTFDANDSTVTIKSNILQLDDILVVLCAPIAGFRNQFDLVGNKLTFPDPITQGIVKVSTFANHDDLDLRTETFLGTLLNRFKISRPVSDINYIWIAVNGNVLINGFDYTVLPDRTTVQLSDRWHLDQQDFITITSLNDTNPYDSVLGYRIFNDSLNRYHYKRLAKIYTTELSRPLLHSDTEIHVVDSDVLTPPLIAKKIPGIIFVNNERIEFNEITGNVLKKLRRATLGTSFNNYIPIGTKVIDQSPVQSIPYNDILQKQTMLTVSSTATYNISTIDTITSASISGDTIISNGIILSTTSTVRPVDQIEVYYGGRKLRKNGILVHDTNKAYDSPEYTIAGFISTIAGLPTTDVINTAYIVTATNQVWIYTGSLEKDAVNGYVYKGLNYLEPEFSVTVSVNTSLAAIYATTASQLVSSMIQDLSYDINGSGTLTSDDVSVYTQLANGQYVSRINVNSNYVHLLNQSITLNIKDGVKDNIRLVIMKKSFDKTLIWNEQITDDTTKPLFESSTVQAKFLQDKLSELPYENYYININNLNLDSGLALLDENNEPLEGL